MAAITGVSRSFTKALTTAPNAAPITTPTARSTTLPRRTNSRNPLNMSASLRFPTLRDPGRSIQARYAWPALECFVTAWKDLRVTIGVLAPSRAHRATVVVRPRDRQPALGWDLPSEASL